MRWKKSDVQAFRARDWGLFERAPAAIDSARSEALAGSLYQQVRRAVPGWPTALDRDQDLAAHLRLVALFERIYDAQCRGSDPR